MSEPVRAMQCRSLWPWKIRTSRQEEVRSGRYTHHELGHHDLALTQTFQELPVWGPLTVTPFHAFHSHPYSSTYSVFSTSFHCGLLPSMCIILLILFSFSFSSLSYLTYLICSSLILFCFSVTLLLHFYSLFHFYSFLHLFLFLLEYIFLMLLYFICCLLSSPQHSVCCLPVCKCGPLLYCSDTAPTGSFSPSQLLPALVFITDRLFRAAFSYTRRTEGAGSSETLISIYQTLRPRISKNSNVNVKMVVTVMGRYVVEWIHPTHDILNFWAFVKG
jgi:hypothetical protein